MDSRTPECTVCGAGAVRSGGHADWCERIGKALADGSFGKNQAQRDGILVEAHFVWLGDQSPVEVSA